MSTTNDSKAVFPLSSENERDVLVAWFKTKMGLKELLEILISKFLELSEPTTHIEDRLNNFGFTKIDGNMYNNPLTELFLLHFSHRQYKKNNNDDKAKIILDKMKKTFDKLVILTKVNKLFL